jgi:hypothetical protein
LNNSSLPSPFGHFLVCRLRKVRQGSRSSRRIVRKLFQNDKKCVSCLRYVRRLRKDGQKDQLREKGSRVGQDPEKQGRHLPAMAPSRDPDAPRDIRTSPINRTRNNCHDAGCHIKYIIMMRQNKPRKTYTLPLHMHLFRPFFCSTCRLFSIPHR